MTCMELQDLCDIYRGDSITLDVECKDQDDGIVDISGMTIVFTAKLNINNDDRVKGDLKISKIITDGANGKCTVELLSKNTILLVPGRQMHYDIKLTDGDMVNTIASGNFQVMDTVAKVFK